jgi:hypothetical protein
MLLDNDLWEDVFEAHSDPDALETTVYGLTTSKLYHFRVFARDFNGYSAPSEVFHIYACGLPRMFSAPTYVWSTSTTIEIAWEEPKIDGGCPIFDYQV